MKANRCHTTRSVKHPPKCLLRPPCSPLLKMIPANVGGVSAAHDYPELQTFFRSESRGPTKTIQKHTFVTDSLAQPLIENPNERYTHVCYERPPDLSFGKLKVNRPHRSQSWQSYHPQHLTSQHDPAKSEDSSLAILFLFPSP